MKIGFLSMPLTGHLNPMTALGRKMQARGHEVTFFGPPDAARIVHSAGLDFVPFGEEEYPVGTTPANYARLATLKGEDVVRYFFQEMHPPFPSEKDLLQPSAVSCYFVYGACCRFPFLFVRQSAEERLCMHQQVHGGISRCSVTVARPPQVPKSRPPRPCFRVPSCRGRNVNRHRLG